jgi:hypothetical protein
VFLDIGQDEAFHGFEVDLFFVLDGLQLRRFGLGLLGIGLKILLWVGLSLNADFGLVLLVLGVLLLLLVIVENDGLLFENLLGRLFGICCLFGFRG